MLTVLGFPRAFAPSSRALAAPGGSSEAASSWKERSVDAPSSVDGTDVGQGDGVLVLSAVDVLTEPRQKCRRRSRLGGKRAGAGRSMANWAFHWRRGGGGQPEHGSTEYFRIQYGHDRVPAAGCRCRGCAAAWLCPFDRAGRLGRTSAAIPFCRSDPWPECSTRPRPGCAARLHKKPVSSLPYSILRTSVLKAKRRTSHFPFALIFPDSRGLLGNCDGAATARDRRGFYPRTFSMGRTLHATPPPPPPPLPSTPHLAHRDSLRR